MNLVAALFVEPGGHYFGLPGVDPWPRERDARSYAGPDPVVAHPPCERWGKYWAGRPGFARFSKGDDAGCFAAALNAVRAWGGVLEHPHASGAWKVFGLTIPPREGGWIPADHYGGWTCYVEQGAYGHPARKETWLYACHCALFDLRWGRQVGHFRSVENMPSAGYQRMQTPVAFRDQLIAIARSAVPDRRIAA